MDWASQDMEEGMQAARVLIIGAGIGGLTAAIALGKRGFAVDMIERDADWSVYGVGIIQQANVIRAMSELGIVREYLDAGFGFDHVDVYSPTGAHLAKVPSPRLVDEYPANIGVGRRALHEVLGRCARAAGASIHLGVTANSLHDDGESVEVSFSDGAAGRYDVVIGADGVNSTTREQIFPDAPRPQFTGQGVWRHNFPRPPEVTSLHAYAGPRGMGLVPLGAGLMYLFVTTPEPGNPHYPRTGLATAMREKLRDAPPAIAALAEQIRDDEAVVYKPLEWVLLSGEWHRGRVVLLGDAVHATTPHLGQGAGMAIEDGIVLADELLRATEPEEAFAAYRSRRFERCRYIVEHSKAIGDSQLGLLPPVDQARATREMFEVIAAPI
jgi:2-polyprenyl-6-methoxyphenol hydroxylase-like FAD-dependent oxidoreductase